MQIGPRTKVSPLTVALLGSHELWRPSGPQAFYIDPGIGGAKCNTEVRDLDVLSVGQQNIAWFEVSMDHASRMCVCEALEQLDQHGLQGRPISNLLWPGWGRIYELHDEVRTSWTEELLTPRSRLNLTEIIDLHDVGWSSRDIERASLRKVWRNRGR